MASNGEKKGPGKATDRPADDMTGDEGLANALKKRRKAIERGNPERSDEAFEEGLKGKEAGDGTSGAKEDD